MGTQTYNDPAKQRSRGRIRAFIEHNLRFKRKNDLRVVCFPGAETTGEEGIEVKEIYDQLGIPRTNITGLEQDPTRAERLRKAGLGITVVECSAREFFDRQGKQYDIISLDYCGQQTEAELETIELLVRRRALRPTGILATLFSGKRESKSLQRELAKRDIIRQHDSAILADRYNLRELVDIATKRVELYRKLNEQADPHLKVNPLAKLRNSITYRLLDIIEGGANIPVSTKTVENLFTIPQAARAMFVYLPELDREDLVRRVRLIAGYETTLPGAVSAMDRFQYVSNKGYLMLGDAFCVRRNDYLTSSCEEIVSLDRNTGVMTFNPRNMQPRKLGRAIVDASEEVKAHNAIGAYTGPSNQDLPARVDLGSSWLRKERIRAGDVAEFIRDGVSIEEIAAAYALPKVLTPDQGLALREAGVTPAEFKQYFGQPLMRVAGWAAHATRNAQAQTEVRDAIN